jgi:hypothetical protein
MDASKLPEYATLWLAQNCSHVEGYNFVGSSTRLAWRYDIPDDQAPADLEAAILERWDGVRQRLVARLGDGSVARRGRIILGEDLRHRKERNDQATTAALLTPTSGRNGATEGDDARPLVWALVELTDRAMAHTETMAELTAGAWDEDRAARVDAVERAALADAAATIERERGRWDAGQWLALVAGVTELAAPLLPAAKGAVGKLASQAKRLRGLFSADAGHALTDSNGEG